MVSRSQSIGFSAGTTMLLVLLPKCPLCWIALMSTIGVSWPFGPGWLHSFVVVLLLLPLGLLLVRAHQCHNYHPFILGCVAAILLYVCRFRLALDVGVYLSGAILFAATVWSARLSRQTNSDTLCRC